MRKQLSKTECLCDAGKTDYSHPANPLTNFGGHCEALIMIIFANILLDKAIITSATFTALLLMAIASTMLTVPVVTPKLQRMKQLILRSQ